MTKQEKWGLGTLALCAAILVGISRLLFPHSFIEDLLAAYIFVAVLFTLLSAVGFLILLRQNLIARIAYKNLSSSPIWTKLHRGSIESITIVVVSLNWLGWLVVHGKRTLESSWPSGPSLGAQMRQLGYDSDHLYYYAPYNLIGSLVVTLGAIYLPLSGPIELVALVVVVSIMLRHVLLLLTPNGTMNLIRSQRRYSPFVAYAILTLCDLTSLSLITAVSGRWFSGKAMTLPALQSAATTLLEGPKYLLASLSPGTPASFSSVVHAPFSQQLVLLAGVLFWASIIRVFSSVFKKDDDALISLSKSHFSQGSYQHALTCLLELTHINAQSELTRARAQLAMGRIAEARASMRRSLNLDPNFNFDPTPTDAYFGLFALHTYQRETAPQLWGSVLQADVSEAMLFQMLREELFLTRMESKQELAVSLDAFAGRPLLEAGVCVIRDDPQACLAALSSASPEDVSGRFIFSTLECWANAKTLGTQQAKLYVESWMKRQSGPFQSAAAELMKGRAWQQGLAIGMAAFLAANFQEIDAAAAQWASALQEEATKAANEAMPDYDVTQRFISERLGLGGPAFPKKALGDEAQGKRPQSLQSA